MNWWVTSVLSAPNGQVLLGSWIFWVIFSITLHELAHGWAAIRLGDTTPIYTGHMTWNPVVHMGPMSLIVFALLGIAWGQMPVDPSRLRGRYGNSIVAVAGPLANIALMFLAIILAVLWPYAKSLVAPHVHTNVEIFLNTGAMLNVVLFFFNLVPVPPLDGWRIGCDVFPRFARIWEGERGAVIGLIAFAVLFAVGGKFIWAFGVSVAQTIAVPFFLLAEAFLGRAPI